MNDFPHYDGYSTSRDFFTVYFVKHDPPNDRYMVILYKEMEAFMRHMGISPDIHPHQTIFPEIMYLSVSLRDLTDEQQVWLTLMGKTP